MNRIKICMFITTFLATSSAFADPIVKQKSSTPVAKESSANQAAPLAEVGLGDLKNGISGGNSSNSGSNPTGIDGSGGANRQQQRAGTKKQTKGAPSGSLAYGGAEARQSAIEAERGKEVDASELVKSRQDRTVEGLTNAVAPLGGLGGRPVTDRSGERANPLAGQDSNPLDAADATRTVDDSDGKNQSSKRDQQSDIPNASREGTPGSREVTPLSRDEIRARAARDAAARRTAEAEQDSHLTNEDKEAIKDYNESAQGRWDKDGLSGVMGWAWARASKPFFDEKTWGKRFRPDVNSAEGSRGTPTPDEAAGDGGPVPDAVSTVDKKHRSVRETRAALRRQVTTPGESGASSTERTTVNPGKAAKAVMGAKQQNLINPSREDSTVTSAPVAGTSAGQPATNNPVPVGGGNKNPDGTGGEGGGGGNPSCPTCQ